MYEEGRRSVMIVCIPLDDNNGMLFNNRRQSQDKVLREHLLKECEGNILWMNEYSSKQFEVPLPENIVVDEEFLDKASEEAYCFVENMSLVKYTDRINRIIIFRWNRTYPADMYFDIPLAEGKWSIISSEDFEGFSHKVITKEVFKNEGQEGKHSIC